jgi:hypothetical protein
MKKKKMTGGQSLLGLLDALLASKPGTEIDMSNEPIPVPTIEEVPTEIEETDSGLAIPAWPKKPKLYKK